MPISRRPRNTAKAILPRSKAGFQVSAEDWRFYFLIKDDAYVITAVIPPKVNLRDMNKPSRLSEVKSSSLDDLELEDARVLYDSDVFSTLSGKRGDEEKPLPVNFADGLAPNEDRCRHGRNSPSR